MQPVFARAAEQQKLRQLMASPKPELVAIYGRRRVGKTFTVSQTLQENSAALYFEITGNLREDGRPQPQRLFLEDFTVAWQLQMKTRRAFDSPDDVLLALGDLSVLAKDRPVFIFIDELPCIARASPRFFTGLATLWSNTLSKNPRLKLFVTGSATSWMTNHVLQARAGLGKRVTANIHMRPLDLAQTGQFLAAKGLRLSHDEALQIYSALGGIPYYLDILDPTLGVTKNLYNLLAADEGPLYVGREYEELFRYLFTRDGNYTKVIDTLASKKHGLSTSELAREVLGKEQRSGSMLRIMESLVRNNFIDNRTMLFSSRHAQGHRLFVSDEYVRFVSRWLRKSPVTTYAAFSKIFSSKSYASWQEFDLQLIVFENAHLIAEALGLSGISIEPTIYYSNGNVQIDLLLARGDRTITICEAKSCDQEYEPTKRDVATFQVRRKAIQDLLKAKHGPEHCINCCYIVRNGIKRNQYFREINPLVVEVSRMLSRC